MGAAQIEAHAIALNIAATAFMVPLGLGMAATVRVGHAYGARDAAAASRAGWTVFGLALAFVAASAAAMAFAPRLLNLGVHGCRRPAQRRRRWLTR